MNNSSQAFDTAMRQARLAQAAHLDALAAAQDAKALRLDHVRGLLLAQLPEGHRLRDSMLLRLPPEDEARLLLDLARSVVMSGDGRTYRLEEDRPSGRQVLLESHEAQEIASEVLRLAALAEVEAAQGKASIRPFAQDGWGQAAFLFAVGAVFGASALAGIALYLKKLTF